MDDLNRQQLLLLPERQAVEVFLDARVRAALAWLLGGGAAVAAVAAIVLAGQRQWNRAGLAALALALILALLVGRRGRLMVEHTRPLLTSFLVIEFALAVLLVDLLPVVMVLGAFLFPALLLVLRLPPLYHLLLSAVFAGTGVWAALQPGVVGGADTPATLRSLVVLLPAGALTAAAVGLSRRARRRFVELWRLEAPRERERLRMRDEIADARKIQLSMLPLAAPELPWLELASVSLPANEVGGDYYDYVPLDGGSLALVVGDVAGHGVASGLVLSGVRSGLYLLRDELDAPAAALGKLNRMVRDSARWRMYVTLLVAVLDPGARRLRAVSAGHPPLLCWSRRRAEVVELGAGAAPLGTGLPAQYREVELPLEEGDVLLLYSDGLTEARNLAGDPYGIDRLSRELATHAGLPSALQIRDRLLHALSRFKGDAVQADDLTLLVARVRGLDTNLVEH